MFKHFNETQLEEINIKKNNQISTENTDSLDTTLAHELAHCLREQDTEKFIYIYDFKIPDTFDTNRLETLKEKSRYLSELKKSEFDKICNDLNCAISKENQMDNSRIIKNEEYFSKQTDPKTKDRIKYENETLAKKLLEDSDNEDNRKNFTLPKLINRNNEYQSSASAMCRDGFVTNQRYQTYKDNKRNETQLTYCYDEVFQVKNDEGESDDVESDEKDSKILTSSSASSSVSFQSINKNPEHVVIDMMNDQEEDDYSSFVQNIQIENKYEQEAELLRKFENECKLGAVSSQQSDSSSATRSPMAYKLIAQSQADRNKLDKTIEDKMKDDFTKNCEYDNDSDSNRPTDNSDFLLNQILSKLVEKNSLKKPQKTTSSIQFNNYNFDELTKYDDKNLSYYSMKENEGKNSLILGDTKLACKNDNLDSHGSSMTNSSKHEDDEEEKDDDEEIDYDQYFRDKETKKYNDRMSDKSDCLKKTIEELSHKHVNESKKTLNNTNSNELPKTSNVNKYPNSSNSTSAGFHQKYQNYSYDLNYMNHEKQQRNKSADENVSNQKKLLPNSKKNQQKINKNQNVTETSSNYSKHYTDDVDTLLQFITSAPLASQQKNKSKKASNTEPSNQTQNNNTNNNKNSTKKAKKNDDVRRKASLEEGKISEIQNQISTSNENIEDSNQKEAVNDFKSFSKESMSHPENHESHYTTEETDFVTVIKGKKIKKENKETNQQIDTLKVDFGMSKNIFSNKSFKKSNSVEKTKKESEKKQNDTQITTVEILTTVEVDTQKEIKVETESKENITQSQNEEKQNQNSVCEDFFVKSEVQVCNDSVNVLPKLHTEPKIEKILKKSLSVTTNRKNPVVFLDEVHMKKTTSIPLDIKFGSIHSSNEEENIEPLVEFGNFVENANENTIEDTNEKVLTANSDTDQTILVSVKKKTKSKRNKSYRIASKQLDYIQNNFSSNSSAMPSSSCDESEKVSSGSTRRKALKKKLARKIKAEDSNQDENRIETDQTNLQNYLASNLQQYQPYLIYQIDPNTNLPIAYIPIAINPLNYNQQTSSDKINYQYQQANEIQQTYQYVYPQYNYQQLYNTNYSQMPMSYPFWFKQTADPSIVNNNLFYYQNNNFTTTTTTTTNTSSTTNNNSNNVQDRVNQRDFTSQKNNFYINADYASNSHNFNLNQNTYSSYPSFTHFNNQNNYLNRSNSFSVNQTNEQVALNDNKKFTYANNLSTENDNNQSILDNSNFNKNVPNVNSNLKFGKNARFRNNVQ